MLLSLVSRYEPQGPREVVSAPLPLLFLLLLLVLHALGQDDLHLAPPLLAASPAPGGAASLVPSLPVNNDNNDRFYFDEVMTKFTC